MPKSKKTVLKPFHESIVDLMNSVGNDRDGSDLSRFLDPRQTLRMVAVMLTTTKVTHGHDKIISTWQKLIQHYELNDERGVVECMIVQKDAAQTKLHPNTNGIRRSKNLNGLQAEVL
jgi:hypothetical protein